MSSESIDSTTQQSSDRLTTGVPGLDPIVHGGYVPARNYLIRGGPGVGKTLLGVHFLAAGLEVGDQPMFISMGEIEADLRENARSFGFDLTNVPILDLSPTPAAFEHDETSEDIFPPDEEGRSVTTQIAEEVLAVEPDRVVVDPLTLFRYLGVDESLLRRRLLSFLASLKAQEATVLFTSEHTQLVPDDDLQFMSDGVITLRAAAGNRTLEVTKFRKSNFQSGTHSIRIDDDGMRVFAQLVPETQHVDVDFSTEQLPSGVPELDQLLHGGLERGTTTILTGPSGVGKTTIGAQYLKEGASHGDRSVMYLFEEAKPTLLHRAKSIGLPLREMIEHGTLVVEEIDPQDISPEEFANRVRQGVEQEDTRLVMIDGIDGYRTMFPHDRDTEAYERRLNPLTTYLQRQGVTTILTSEVRDITGNFQATDHPVSYLGDNLVFLRYLELDGELQKAIGVLKKRASDFERTLRTFEITPQGLSVGEPLTGLQGILKGIPESTD